jgi:hypothetical protein
MNRIRLARVQFHRNEKLFELEQSDDYLGATDSYLPADGLELSYLPNLGVVEASVPDRRPVWVPREAVKRMHPDAAELTNPERAVETMTEVTPAADVAPASNPRRPRRAAK